LIIARRHLLSAGLIDKFSPSLDIFELIGQVAEDVASSAKGGEAVFLACRLYILANASLVMFYFRARDPISSIQKPKEAVRTMNTQLSVFVLNHDANSKPSSNTTEVEQKSLEMAEWLSRYYKSRGGEVAQLLSTLHQLLEAHRFLHYYRQGEYEAALRVMEAMGVIPLDQEDLQSHVSEFHTVPSEVGGKMVGAQLNDGAWFKVRLILPDLCVSVMRCLVALHEKAREEDGSGGGEDRQEVMGRTRAYAKTIILYSAMIPYRFPVSTNSTLLRLQAHIA